MSGVNVLAIDLSLTGTGVVRVINESVHPRLIKSAGRKTDSLAARRERINRIESSIFGWLQHADLAVIEQPSYGSITGHHHDRSGLWWLVVDRLIWLEVPVVEVPPSTLKKYATGKGNAGKDQMLAAAIRRYPDVAIDDNNVADAMHLASMGCRFLGAPLEDSATIGMAQAMQAVRWPVGEPA